MSPLLALLCLLSLSDFGKLFSLPTEPLLLKLIKTFSSLSLKHRKRLQPLVSRELPPLSSSCAATTTVRTAVSIPTKNTVTTTTSVIQRQEMLFCKPVPMDWRLRAQKEDCGETATTRTVWDVRTGQRRWASSRSAARTASGNTVSSLTPRPAPGTGSAGTERPRSSSAPSPCCTTTSSTPVTGPTMCQTARSIVSICTRAARFPLPHADS